MLLDPYARKLSGAIKWDDSLYGYTISDAQDADLVMDKRDSAAFMPKGIVIDPATLVKAKKPNIRWPKTIIYEAHVRGLTMQHPLIPNDIRGTFAALSDSALISHLQKIGITAIELLPIHAFTQDHYLLEKNLSNYWGYNNLSYFAPEPAYMGSGEVEEIAKTVDSLHEAGIEVILDVVYNHTCEGNHMGPMLSWKGVCNTTYYRLMQDDPQFYMDYTGTGNSLNVRNPQVLKMIMDSLRYWVTHMHVDGFRFDLAATLARELHDVSKLSSFFDTIHQDPTLAEVKLIAEPWDVGEGGYQVGQFPVLWAEWNGKYRDTVRRFWKGDGGQLSDFAYRLTGSSDLYKFDGRKPYASINFVTAHDGFTLCDLVSYNEKHNEANGDNNSDGANDNESWNMGAEGPTDDAEVNTLRERQMRNFLSTLMLSQGVPMLAGGDEVARSQRGNNNCYCQDNELTWFDWDLDDSRKRLHDFTCQIIQLRRAHPNLHRRKFFQDREVRKKEDGSLVRLDKDASWFHPDGNEVSDEAWNAEWSRAIALLLNGRTLQVSDENGAWVIDDSFLLLVNAAHEGVELTLPESPSKKTWSQVVDTENIEEPFAKIPVNGKLILGGRSLKLLSDG